MQFTCRGAHQGRTQADRFDNAFDGWRTAYTAYAAGESIYPPEVPVPAADSEARALIDFVLNLK